LPQGQGQGIIDNDDGALPAPPVADYNGDGRTDILWRNATSNRLVSWLMNGLVRVSGDFVTQGGVPIALDPGSTVVAPPDFDGDGDGDVLVQTSTGALEYRYLNGLVQVDQQSRTGMLDLNWRVAG